MDSKNRTGHTPSSLAKSDTEGLRKAFADAAQASLESNKLRDYYFSCVCAEFPEFSQSQDVELFTKNGGENNVIIIDKKVVFRFPKKERAKRSMKREIDILSACESHMGDISFPRPRYKSSARDFWGYECIPGEQLRGSDVWKNHKLARDIAHVLNIFHSIPVDAFKDVGLIHEERHIQKDVDETIEKLGGLGKYLTDEQITKAQSLVQTYVGAVPRDEHICFTHGDIAGNILFDRESGRITGVIDFTNASLYDPAVDFSLFMEWDGELLEMILKHYTGYSEEFQKRMDFFFHRHCLIQLPKICRGLDEGKNIERYQRRFQKVIATLGLQ